MNPTTPLPKDYTQEWTEIQGMQFTIPYGVFIPRPDTEHWLSKVLERYTDTFKDAQMCIDLCSGAGLIGAMTRKSFSSLPIISLELNPIAVEAQKKTFVKNDLSGIDVRESDLFGALKPHELQTPWILLANPPYVPEEDRKYMKEHNIEHEPQDAIFGGGANGLELYEKILHKLETMPRPALAAFELDPRNILQATQLAKKHFTDIVCHHITDQNGWHRALVIEFNASV